MSGSRLLIRKAVLGVAILVGFTALAGLAGHGIASGFVPDEDQGYFFVNVQLPDAASLERTDAVCRKVEAILGATPEIESFNTVAGFSLLTYASATYNGFYFVTLKEWSKRPGSEHTAAAVVNRLNWELAGKINEGIVFGFAPPAIAGLGNSGGFSMWVQDRSGGDVEFLNTNLQKFMEAARKQPEVGSINTLFRASVPQVFAEVDRDKILKQGVNIADVYQTLQAFLGGSYINQFNRFGRQWKVYLEAESDQRANEDKIGNYYVRNSNGDMVPLSALASTKRVYVHQPLQPLPRRPGHRQPRSRLQLRPGDERPRTRGRRCFAPRDGLRVGRPLLPTTEGRWHRRCHFRALAALRFLDPGSPVRELVAPLQRAALSPDRGHRGVRRVAHARVLLRHLRADRPGDAGRPGGEERHLDRRVRQGRVREGSAPGRGRVGGCEAPNLSKEPLKILSQTFRTHFSGWPRFRSLIEEIFFAREENNHGNRL